MQYEFEIVQYDYWGDFLGELNRLGKEGWHVVASIDGNKAILQREVRPSTYIKTEQTMQTTAVESLVHEFFAAMSNS